MHNKHTHTHTHTHVDTIHQTKIYHIMIHFYIPQVMDSQVDSKILSNILENDMILLIGRESDTDLLETNSDVNSYKKPFSIWPFYWPAHQPTTPQTLPCPPHTPQSPTHYPT